MTNGLAILASYAQEAAGSGAAEGQPVGGCGGQSGMSSMLMMALMIGVFYFLIIRPQSKKAKEHARMINELKKGDQVITRGGIIGKISGVQDNVLVLELQEKVRVRVLKSFVDGRFAEGGQAAKAGETAATESKN